MEVGINGLSGGGSGVGVQWAGLDLGMAVGTTDGLFLQVVAGDEALVID